LASREVERFLFAGGPDNGGQLADAPGGDVGESWQDCGKIVAHQQSRQPTAFNGG